MKVATRLTEDLTDFQLAHMRTGSELVQELCVNGPVFGQRLVGALQDGLLPGIPLSSGNSNINVWEVGIGESYVVWAVSDGESTYAVRVPHHPLDQMHRTMAQEFQFASKVPAKVGLKALFFEPDAAGPLGVPYMVTEFSEGSTKTAWSGRDFEALVPVLVELHSHRSWHQESDVVDDSIDLLKGFREAWDWWRQSERELTESAAVMELRDRVDRFVAERQWACQGAQKCAIHSDLCATNVLFDPDDNPLLIDWEWAEDGDPAKDLAYVGGEAFLEPWYVPMTRSQVKQFVLEYVDKAFASLAPAQREDQYQRLLARRDSWEAWERYTMGLHCLRRGRDEDSEFYKSAGQQVHERLAGLLDREEAERVHA